MSTPRKELSTEKKKIIIQLCRDGMKQTEVARALGIRTPMICLSQALSRKWFLGK
jgi:DNA-binding NarL/FixJ family response regulator